MATTARSASAFSRRSTTTTLFTPSSRPLSPQTVILQLHHRYSSPTATSIWRCSSSHSSSVCILEQQQTIPKKKKTCVCSPSTHPGSYRCKLPRSSSSPAKRQRTTTTTTAQPFTAVHKFPLSDGLALRRLALTNSLKKIGPVEGEVAMRFLAMRSQPRYRDQAFQPRPSRLSLLSSADVSS